MANYSHTKLSTYEQCPQKYKFHYIDGIKAEKKTVETFLGSRVHETLEKLYRDLQVSKLNTLDELQVYYTQQWQKNFTPDVEVLRADTNPQHYFENGKRMLENYYRRFHPFDQNLTLDLEVRVTFPLDDRTTFQGIVDRVAKNGDHSYEIHDYKTSRRLPPQAEVERDRQLPLYEVAVRQRWPDAREVTLVWHYLAAATDLETRKSPQQLEALKQDTLRLVRTIEGAREFPTHETPLCDWCEYYSICTAKQHEVRLAALPLPAVPAETGVRLVDRYVALKESKKKFEQEIDQLEQAILEYAAKNQLAVVVGTDKKVRIQEKQVTSLPTKGDDPEAYGRVVELLRQSDQWGNLSTLDRNAALAALEKGELPEPLARQLQPYLKRESKKALFISRRDDAE